MQNPVDKYPHPPFKRQTQPWPGLASKMDPKPDHGETSYKGSGRLAGRKALITGGDSGMGRAAAIAYAREGADVAINYFPTEEPDAQDVIALIKAEGRIGLALPGDIRDEAFCKKLVADAVAGLGGLDIVVSNAGRQQAHESILDISTVGAAGSERGLLLLQHRGMPAGALFFGPRLQQGDHGGELFLSLSTIGLTLRNGGAAAAFQRHRQGQAPNGDTWAVEAVP